MRTASRTRACVLLLVALGASAGCRSKPASVPPPTDPLVFDDDAGAEPVDASGSPVDKRPPAKCTAAGVVWDGKHEGCLYEVGGCCYPDAGSACAAAGCEADTCQVLESAPAQIVCTVAGKP